ncbi:hypothetical protein SASPL_138465 [Salvia splendens]|uniref:Uncharacterized protein n=1 Tax=Salvia splendens TaxID=180675 RepID=A0A8X8WV78_SALSN|nr:hypothetical protein SASPL_138465 [Salvia splendens]
MFKRNDWEILECDSVENTPRSTIDLTRKYTLIVRTSSYGELRSTFDQDTSFDQTVDSGHLDGIQGDKLLEQIFQPSLHQARLAYAPIHDLLNNLPLEFESDSYSLSDSKCNLAYNVFLQFDRLENPFISNASQNFDDMRQLFSQLTHELNHHPVKPRSRATNALVALAGSPICFALFPSNMIKKERGNLVLLDEASRSAYVLRRDLDTIDRLVSHVYDDVEYDKFSIHHALEREMDKYLIQQVLKQLQRNRPSFMERLTYLEGNLFLCFDAIKQTRSCILQKIHLHQLPD